MHNTVSLDPVAASKLQLILTKLTHIERKLEHMDEQIDQLNATADAELAAEIDLATQVHSALGLIEAEMQQISDLSAQLAILQGQNAGGVVVPVSKIAALQTKMNTSVSNVLAQVAALKAVQPPPPPPAPVAPTITTTALPNGTDGQAYSFQFQATGDAPITFAAANPPAGFSMVVDGTLSGTAVAGTYSIDVTATNPAGSVTSTFTLTVDPAAAPVVAGQ